MKLYYSYVIKNNRVSLERSLYIFLLKEPLNEFYWLFFGRRLPFSFLWLKVSASRSTFTSILTFGAVTDRALKAFPPSSSIPWTHQVSIPGPVLLRPFNKTKLADSFTVNFSSVHIKEKVTRPGVLHTIFHHYYALRFYTVNVFMTSLGARELQFAWLKRRLWFSRSSEQNINIIYTLCFV